MSRHDYCVEVYEEDGVFEASTYIANAPEPYVRNPFVTAKTRDEAVALLDEMVEEILGAQQ